MDPLDPSKTITHCKLDKLTYNVDQLKAIGQKILVSEIINHNHVYIVSEKVFKAVKEKK